VTTDATSPCSHRYVLRICSGPSCGQHSEALIEPARAVLATDPDLQARVEVGAFECFGRCADGPNCFLQRVDPGVDPSLEPDLEVLEEQPGFYPEVDVAALRRIVLEHAKTGAPVSDLLDEY